MLRKKASIGVIFVLVASVIYAFISVPTSEKSDGYWAVENFDFYPQSSGLRVQHEYYQLSYREEYEQAEWVAYHLTADQLTSNRRKRPYFKLDPKVKTKSAHYKNFKNSGYNKGHLCPAADRKFSEKAYNETFYTSNVSPQKNKFNAGIWNRLEQKVRYWVQRDKSLFVVTGGVLTNGLPTIGSEEVAVPKYFYKVLLRETKKEPSAIAFLIPHEASDQPLYKYVVSIDSIETLTGIDFFPALTDEIENKLEASSSYKAWSF
ncbi:DNA/RNA non-specific endonuclease [Flavobacteriaceae bacterium F08102]|nr:DNA/RNA non-specific endonuclease [Flavobacteriaceae bacterium F08102]